MSDANLTPAQRRAARLRAEAERMLREEGALPAAEKPNEEATIEDPPAAEKPVATPPPTLADLGLKTAEEPRVYSELSAEEIEEIKVQARKRVAEEKKKAQRKAALEEAMEEARLEAGTLPEDELRERELEELVFIRIDLPKLRTTTGREIPPDPIIIDQRVFAHGWSGYVPRGQFEYLKGLMSQCWIQQAATEGRSRTYYNEQFGATMHMSGYAAGGTMTSGPAFPGPRRTSGEPAAPAPRRLS